MDTLTITGIAEDGAGELRPVLARYPDARRAGSRTFDAIALVYLAFVLGPAIGALAALYNAILLRRLANALVALLLGLAGWGTFVFVALTASDFGIHSLPTCLIASRAVHFAIGGLLAWSQIQYLRGHEHLGGAHIPLLPAFLIAFGVSVFAPWRLMLVLWGVPGGN